MIERTETEGCVSVVAMDFFDIFPPELIHMILVKHSDECTMTVCSFVCRRWREALKHRVMSGKRLCWPCSSGAADAAEVGQRGRVSVGRRDVCGSCGRGSAGNVAMGQIDGMSVGCAHMQ